MSTFLTPTSLQGRHVLLEPLTADHAEPLRKAATDGELWKLWFTSVPAPEGVAEYVRDKLSKQAQGTMQSFVVRLLSTGDVVGHTAFANVDANNRRVEIGYTWYAACVQRTAVNTETKFLLLQHAFESLHCIAVEFRTHWLNQRSRAAIARLGAKQDGVLRNHQRLPDGSFRDTVVFSIIESEWLAVKQHLSFKLEQGEQA